VESRPRSRRQFGARSAGELVVVFGRSLGFLAAWPPVCRVNERAGRVRVPLESGPEARENKLHIVSNASRTLSAGRLCTSSELAPDCATTTTTTTTGPLITVLDGDALMIISRSQPASQTHCLACKQTAQTSSKGAIQSAQIEQNGPK